MLTSKEVLERTGISRATLNNYIGSGIVPRPEILQPQPQDGGAPRIGYFPDDVVARIEEIQRLKRDGWSITRITQHFAGGQRPPATPTDLQQEAGGPSKAAQSEMAQPAPAPSSDRPESGGARRRVPELTHVAVLVSDLQDSSRLWAELPPSEYFDLVNQVWLTLDPILRRHRGTHGKHPGEGIVCYFFPSADSSHLWNALSAALQVREAMRHLSAEWQVRKGWATELCMNTAIDEGQEWVGTLRSGAEIEFTVLGDAVDHATQLSNLCRSGAILATRNLVSKLGAAERQRLSYGVRRHGRDGKDVFVPTVFSRVENLPDLAAAIGEVRAAVGRLAVTEIIDLAASAGGEGATTENNHPLQSGER